MLCTELYNGQGLGNQLWCYCVTRALALDRGFDFGIQSPEKFKGHQFMNLDFGKKLIGGEGPEGGPPSRLPDEISYYYCEQKVYSVRFKCDITTYDVGMTKVPDGTKLEGAMQSERYIKKYRNEIFNWLKPTKTINEFANDSICVIHVRGGDFTGIKDVFLPPTYYTNAMNHMRGANPSMKFVCVTDHPEAARSVVGPDVPIVGSAITGGSDSNRADHHRGGPIWMDYSILNQASFLIIPNSSFSWWAAWTNPRVRAVIAPKYWARFNVSDGFWSQGDALTSGWHYLDRDGRLFNYEACLSELVNYHIVNPVRAKVTLSGLPEVPAGYDFVQI